MQNKDLDSFSSIVKILQEVVSIKRFVLRIKIVIDIRSEKIILFLVLLVIVLNLYEINVLFKGQKNVYRIYGQDLLDIINIEEVF